MKIAAFGLSDVGKQREKNEDSFLVRGDLELYAVCDGMGGHKGGDYASQEAIDILEDIVSSLRKDPGSLLKYGEEVPENDYQSHIRYALRIASRRIYQRSLEDSQLRGMGTTAVVLYFRENKVYVANVGDSRAYRMRNGKLRQITTDHSLVNEQVRAGMMSPEEARGHRMKNIITRSVGFQQDVDVDVDIRAVLPGDLFLLCSDGLSNMISEAEIEQVIIKNNDLTDICRTLIEMANNKGGDDNVTVILVRVDDLDDISGEFSDDSTVEM